MRVQQKFETPLSNNRWQTNLQKPARSKGESVGSEEHTYSVRVSANESSANESADNVIEIELRRLFSYSNNENPFNETETEILIKAIEACKILDPACGSGAFPIGVLQRLVFLLGKLDADNAKWKQWLKTRAQQQTQKAWDEGDRKQRDVKLLQISEAFEKDSSDFGRKLFLIENCIYGVDIQPIAAEISKLRCFLTLIVDDTIDETKPNRGVNPLPNLEFKFVTADALLKLPESGLFQATTETKLTKLEQIRHEYIQSYGDRKNELKEEFETLQNEIFDKRTENYHKETQDARAIALSTWKPFGHAQVDWLDALWMFGVKGFDIVIGNPPYIRQEKIKHYKTVFAQNYKDVFSGTADILVYFYALGHELLKKNGALTLITSNKFYCANYGENLRKFLSQKSKIRQIIDFGDAPVFEAAAYASINILQKNSPNGNKARVWTFPQYEKVTDFQSGFNRLSFELSQNELTKDGWHFEKLKVLRLFERIKSKGIPLGEYVEGKFYYGIKTGLNEAFVVDQETRDKLIAEHESSREVLKPYLHGRDVKRKNVQILIMTHDKSFFHLAKRRIEFENCAENWIYKELYQGESDSGIPQPFIPGNKDYLAQAKKYLKEFDYPACANYLRKEAERILKHLLPPCKTVYFKEDEGTKLLKLETLIENFKTHYRIFCHDDAEFQREFVEFKKLKEHKDLLLNPLSHDNIDTPIYGQELDSIKVLLEKMRKLDYKLLVSIKDEPEVFIFLTENDTAGEVWTYKIKLTEHLRAFKKLDGKWVLDNPQCEVVARKKVSDGTIENKADNNKLRKIYDRARFALGFRSQPEKDLLDIIFTKDNIKLADLL